MFLNKIFQSSQILFRKFYEKSQILKNIDEFIFISILAVIISSVFLESDSIAIGAILAIILTTIKFLTKPNSEIKISTIEIFLITYLMFLIISVAGSSLFLYSFKGILKTFIYIGFYITLMSYLSDNKSKIKYILFALAIVAIGETFVALKQHFITVAEISGWQDTTRLNPEEIMTRVYGSLKPYNPNLFGGYMISILPSTLILTFLPLYKNDYKKSIIGIFAFIITLIAVVLTGCRGAYIALFSELVLIFFITYKFLKPFYRKIFLYITSFFTMIIMSVVLTLPALKARIFSIFAMRSDSSNSFRFNVYNSCIEMFKDNWLLGIGVGNQNFREVYGLYMKTGFDALSAYNIYLEIAVESGIFALISFLSFLASVFYKAIKYIFNHHNNIELIYIIIAITSITGMLIHGIVDTVFFRPQIQFVFWIMISIIRVITIDRSFDNAITRT